MKKLSKFNRCYTGYSKLKSIFLSILWIVNYLIIQSIVLVILVLAKESQNDTNTEILIGDLLGSCIDALVITSIIFIIYTFINKLCNHKKLDIKHIELRKIVEFIALGAFLNVSLNILANIMYNVVSSDTASELDEAISIALSNDSLLITILTTGIIIPILEELTLRYGMCRHLSNIHPLIGVIVSAVVFGAMHGNLIQFIYATLTGLVLGYVYIKTDNIYYPIVIHCTINSLSVISTYVEIISNSWLIIGISGLIIFIILKALDNRKVKIENENINEVT